MPDNKKTERWFDMGNIIKLNNIDINQLKPYKKNAKKHSKEQISKIADSIKEVGFLNPCLIDMELNVIAGHGRIEAAKLLGIETVPCVYVEGLTEAQKRAYIIADNRLTELGEWDTEALEKELKELLDFDFNIELTGFDLASFYDSDYEDDLKEGQEIDTEQYSDDTFECTCPKCGFKFNRS